MRIEAGSIAGGAERVLLTFWVGSLWTIGYVVAPTLFATLDDRSLAGRIAGDLFQAATWISAVCGGLLLLLWLFGRSRVRRGARFWIVIAMLALIATGEWLVGPVLAETPRGTRAFGLWHGVSALLYLSASLAGLALVAIASPARAK